MPSLRRCLVVAIAALVPACELAFPTSDLSDVPPPVRVSCVPPSCDDQNECTTDTCASTGCTHAPAPGETCGEGCGVGVCDGTGRCAAPVPPANQPACIGAAPCAPEYYVSSFECDKSLCAVGPDGGCGFCNNSFVCAFACADTITVCCGTDTTTCGCPSGYGGDATITMGAGCDGGCGSPGPARVCHASK